MSIATTHNEWLSLIDISGPFLSLNVLTRVFPQGLPIVDSGLRSDLRAAYDEWADNQRGLQQEKAIHKAWFDFVFSDLLGYLPKVFVPCTADDCPAAWQATLAERHLTLRPDYVLRHPSEEKPRLMVLTLPSNQGLEKRSKEAYSAANEMSPATQMLELLRATGVELGLVTNGADWMLVYTTPGETASYATWKTELWLDEPVTLNAFYTLLELGRFFNVPDDELVPALLAASKDNQHDVTDQLGLQVRHAVEILVQSIAQADVDQQGRLLADIDEQTIYEAALTVMMRLVFLLSAEEQGLLLLGDPIYDQNYAISTLRAQLREAADLVGEEVIQRRTDAWARLLATFRAVHTGIWHPQLSLPAYGGSLFDPDRFPFLEGRTAGQPFNDSAVSPLQLDNRTVLHLLQALQQLELKTGGVTTLRTLSFRALDVEQIGHVYEGLLDHQALRAMEVVLGLVGAAGLEPEISLAALEMEAAKGRQALLAFLEAETKRSKSALEKSLAEEMRDLRHSRLLTACGGDEGLFQRVLPYAGLLRDDTRKEPVVILPGEVYVTAGLTRRQTGSHYTPRSLTEPIVQHTLEPLVYYGPAEGLPREQWRLRSAAEILQLKVCDMAMGSGAFLVQGCRYLADRLLEAWQAEAVAVGAEPTPNRPFAGAFEGQNLDELYTLAKRLVAERCLYGVDKNPLAVEMAKLSLWLVTLSKNKPFTFVDHALRHGDSLIGTDEDAYDRWWHSLKGAVGPLYGQENDKALQEARRLRRELQEMQVLDVQDAQRKAALLAEAEQATARIQRACDLLTGIQLLGLSKTEQEAWRQKLLIEHVAHETMTSTEAKQALTTAKKYDALHWFVEFPEVFANDGFSAFVGNPPFIGGRIIRQSLGDKYREGLYEFFPGSQGGADYCAFFFLKGFQNLISTGALGLIATNTIAQGDTRQTGLDKIIGSNGTIYYAFNNVPWPGQAAVSVNILHIYKGNKKPPQFLDGHEVKFISAFLDNRQVTGDPYKLSSNLNLSFTGSVLRGIGFAITQEEADVLLQADPKNSEVLHPFLNGQDLNSDPAQNPSRWVINFNDWPLEICEQYHEPMKIIRERIYPDRMETQSDRKVYEKKWWQFWRIREELYNTIGLLDRTLVVALTSKYLCFSFVPTNWVIAHACGVIAFNKVEEFALLQNSFHDIWARTYGSTLETRLRYTPADVFESFPFPENIAQLKIVGGRYYDNRRQIMLDRQEGLTKTYNRFHDPAETAQDITHLRHLHVEMDNAVAAAYGWQDLPLNHGFHETAQGLRYTISEPVRYEVLTRLLQLNHQRYEEEVAAGLHEKGGKGKKPKAEGRKKKEPKKNDGQMSLF